MTLYGFCINLVNGGTGQEMKTTRKYCLRAWKRVFHYEFCVVRTLDAKTDCAALKKGEKVVKSMEQITTSSLFRILPDFHELYIGRCGKTVL